MAKIIYIRIYNFELPQNYMYIYIIRLPGEAREKFTYTYSGDSQKSWSSPQGLQRRSTKNGTFFDFVSVVALMVITSRNERISLGLRNFYFLPNQKIRSQKKVRTNGR